MIRICMHMLMHRSWLYLCPGFRWQCRANVFLTQTKPHDRPIIVFVDNEGDRGKSTFVKYMYAKHGAFLGNACSNKSSGLTYICTCIKRIQQIQIYIHHAYQNRAAIIRQDIYTRAKKYVYSTSSATTR